MQSTASKVCFKCGQAKPLTAFYKHKKMADGHLNKCIDCAKKDVAEHRVINIEKIRKYDRERGCRQSAEYFKEYDKKYPKKLKARQKVNRAVRAGKLRKYPCEICGCERSVGHHDDYDFPLQVRWLCQAHHKQWHAKHGEGKNG